LRARAIETACWIIAATQWGPHGESGRASYGHAVVVDPWGHVVARKPDGEGWLTAHLDLARPAQVRSQIPVHEHKVL
jgi:nitrilase